VRVRLCFPETGRENFPDQTGLFPLLNPVQRQQSKWVLFGLIAAGCTLPFLTGSISPSSTQPDVFGVIGIPALRVVWLFIPLSIGLAMLRYRLWDIDLIINRTLIYGILTASVIVSTFWW
jgi:hypothetical protein